MSRYNFIRRSQLCPTSSLLIIILILPIIFGFVSSAFAQKNNNNNNNNNNNFKPSKGLHELNNGNNINNSNTVNTRFFQSNFHQFYNPNSQPFNKYNQQFFYPTYPNVPQISFYPGHHRHGIGNYQRQIRVPGVIEIRIQGRDAEITCEFQRYIILIQGIYWHHNIEPYGSYFDTRNGFAPHITVTNVDPWKSVLTIKDFSEDDYGPYKCISTAILPDENNSNNNNNNNNNYNNNNYGYPDVRTNELEETKRKVRFTREVKEQSNPYNAVYDPFFHSNYLGINLNGNLHNHHQQVPQQNYLPNSNHYHTPNTYFPDNYYHNNNHRNYNNYHLTPGYFNHFNLGGFHNYNHNNYNSNWNIHAPYYKPSYSVSTIYQEVNFAPIIPPPTTLQSPGK